MKNMFGYFTKKKNKSKKDINMEASNELYQKNNNMSNKRNKIECWLDHHNHTMELIRILVAIIVLLLQVVIPIRLLEK